MTVFDFELERAIRGFDAESFVRRHGGHKESRSRRSREWLLPCRCGSSRLRWRHEPGVKQAWICWGCGMTGTTLDLVQWLERIGLADAIQFVVGAYEGGDGVQACTASVAAPQRPATAHRLLPPMALPAGAEQLDPGNPAHHAALRYLVSQRGLTLAQIRDYRLHLGTRGFVRDYVIFPCVMHGAIVYWQARATWDPPRGLSAGQLKVWRKATAYRKTLNPRACEGEASAAEVLFGLDQAAVHPTVVVVEGPIDAIRTGPQAVALLGKTLSQAKAARLSSLRATKIVVYLDAGEAEREKALEIAGQLTSGADVYVAQAPEGCDPGSLTPEQNAAVLAQATRFKPQELRARLELK